MTTSQYGANGEGARLKPVPLTASMNIAADHMERMIKTLGVAEDLCMRLTGATPKPQEDGIVDRGALAPADGSTMSLSEVARGQRDTFRALAVRLEAVIDAINEAI